MPRRKRDHQLVLYGPDRKNKARPKKGFKTYRWYIVWYEGSRKREHATGEESFRAAEDYLHNVWLPSRIEKPEGPEEPSRMDVATALSIYGDEHAPTVADPARIASCIDALLDFWDGKTCAMVSRKSCADYLKNRTEAGREVGTARKELGTLQSALNYCHQEGYLTHAPRVSLPPKPEPRDRWLTRQEVAALIHAARTEPKARSHLAMFILMGVYTGARTQAILTLQWQENPSGGWVDLSSERIYWRPPGRKQSKKKRPRSTPIPKRLLRFLRAQRKRTRTFVFEINGKWAGDNKRAFSTARRNAWVKVDPDGNPIRGVLKNVSRHTLKHTCITWMMQKGVPDWEVSGFTGTSVETIRRYYAHHAPDHLEKARRAFD